MKQYLCPSLSIIFYFLYYLLVQGTAYFLPDSIIVTLIIVASVFIIIPIAASHTSAFVMVKIRGFNCRL
ncbi:hypothetical protein [Alkalibacterium pelagium]|jgi:hypothetical protein|uniref:Uncharacterized protein n=1 Tax=Alkalibacterium pelagium TaxID=426702 RepID=A0A1H7P2J0_9LACT|nr:hypothetical protein [Alkalibacterium pelagium]GEN51530.1 hypothetical protein APE02nite_21950 [Alkalibacterium pelagium]SEL30023.1 hypothetical protein SAMN04488099_11720 [Alkalibacterium pelagium]